MNSLQQLHEVRLRGLAGGGVSAELVRVEGSKPTVIDRPVISKERRTAPSAARNPARD
jgi:hypothetical protein